MPESRVSPAFPLPANLTGFWEWDPMMTPWPYTPLSQELIFGGVDAGFSRGMAAFDSPYRLTYRGVNGYAYASIQLRDSSDESLADRQRRYETTLARELPRIAQRWDSEWLPGMLPGLERARTLEYPALTDARLIDTLDTLWDDLVDRYTVHGQFNFIFIAASQFTDFYLETIQPDDPTEPYQLLQGFPNSTVEAGRRLWQLSRLVRHHPELTARLSAAEPVAVLAELLSYAGGPAFVSAFTAYLDEFGWRNDLAELADATWREDPRIPLATLKRYLRLDDAADPDEQLRQAVRRREQLLTQAHGRLAGDAERRVRFDRLYAQATPYLRLSEDHNFYIDQMGVVVLRLPILELGRRLVNRGVVQAQEDVFMLTRRDIRAGMAGVDQRRAVVERRRDLTHWATIVPPASIGEPVEQLGLMDPLGEALAKLFGTPPEPSREPHILTGIGVSPGVVRGPAKVVHHLEEADKVEPGDVLVCDMTMPAWTPLFAVVSAVVTDTGGMLSHCAIVAREYGLPCVVCTRVGTSTVTDGMLLTVDGRAGIVRIEARPLDRAALEVQGRR